MTADANERNCRRCPDGDWSGDTEPGGMECNQCGCIFISNDGRPLCKLCHDALESSRRAETWEWWTSNSWRRLMAPRRGSVQTRAVLMPTVCRDGQPDIVVSEADMALIAAAPDLLALAKQYASECSGCDGTGDEELPEQPGIVSQCVACADIRAVIAKAEGRS